MNERIRARYVDARAVERAVGIADLEQDVDERAALEIVAPEPLVEHVEDREQLLAGLRCPPLDLGFQPVLGPQLLAALEEREHEVVLRREVPVQRQGATPARADDIVEPDRADSLLREQLVGGREDAFARIAAALGRLLGRHDLRRGLHRALR